MVLIHSYILHFIFYSLILLSFSYKLPSSFISGQRSISRPRTACTWLYHIHEKWTNSMKSWKFKQLKYWPVQLHQTLTSVQFSSQIQLPTLRHCNFAGFSTFFNCPTSIGPPQPSRLSFSSSRPGISLLPNNFPSNFYIGISHFSTRGLTNPISCYYVIEHFSSRTASSKKREELLNTHKAK